MLGIAAGRLFSAIVDHASAQDPFVFAAVAVTMRLTDSLSMPIRYGVYCVSIRQFFSMRSEGKLARMTIRHTCSVPTGHMVTDPIGYHSITT
jgi:hypothetical protein